MDCSDVYARIDIGNSAERQDAGDLSGPINNLELAMENQILAKEGLDEGVRTVLEHTLRTLQPQAQAQS